MKRNFRYFSMVLAIILMVSSVSVSYGKKAKNEPQVKYVFYLIGDGMGINAVSGTEIYNRYTGNGPEQVNFLHFPVRTQVNTNSASTLVTGSAAAGTSLATGRKTYTGAIGVDTERNPISSIAEWAKASGAGVGIATSVAINHATPAAFYAHVSNRDSYDAITRQFIHSDVVDFAAGAGFLTERNLGLDATFYEQEARGEGVKVFYGAESFGNVKSEYDRVLCLGGKDLKELPFAIDRKEGDTALKDFVTTGIEYLYGRYAEEGFFFMIEGGKIDYAGHNDDAASCFREINDFAAALDVVLAFCDQHPGETLIVVTADHETGGLALGAGEYKMNPELLACQKMSENELTSKFRQAFMPPPPPQRRGPRNGQGMAPQQPQWTPPTWEEVKEFLKVNLGLWDTVPVDKRTEERFFETYQTTFGAKEGESEVRSLYAVNTRLVSDAVMYLDRAAGYQWAHGAHTGSPVGLYVSGVRAAEFNSCSENTDIPLVIARIAGYDIQH